MSETAPTTEDLLASEIDLLRRTLDEVWPERDRLGRPTWFDRTAREHADDEGNAVSVCVPIRAAVKVLREMG